MDEKITVHMIGSAHIDPVWLWRWPAGVVEVLSTCRTAADLLDRYEEFVFCRSDTWVYETIERYDEELFGRIREHIATGRWQAPGAWYIQSDCNFPLAASFRKHMEIGRRYFADRFQRRIDVGFNVDSFGHSASIPGLLKSAGYDSYVMMRPMQHEMNLPGNLFRWRGDDGSEIVTWRIQRSYNAETPALIQENIDAAVKAAIPGVPEVMCFYGVGDHGGGPTAESIEWIIANTESTSEYRLEFSHPRRFFDSIKTKHHLLPTVEGELQMHAVGCFSVVADIKRGIRNAEHAILRAERADRILGGGDGADSVETTLAEAWRTVLFNQFHDIAGGSSIAEACGDATNQLGGAITAADSVTIARCLDDLVSLPPKSLQRVVAYRFGEFDYDGPITHEPWIHPRGFRTTFGGTLIDESGKTFDYQIVEQSALLGPPRGMLWDDTIAVGKQRIYYLDPRGKPGSAQTDIRAAKNAIENDHRKLEIGEGDALLILESRGRNSTAWREPLSIALFEDKSDTWSHDTEEYLGRELGRFEVTKSDVCETGPIRASIELEAQCRSSRLSLRCSIYRNRPWIDLAIDLVYLERFAIAKLLLPVESASTRLDGIATGSIRRHQDRIERPLLDWTMIERNVSKGDASGFGVVSPDCFAFDGRDGLLRFTLARSPVYAWNQPNRLSPERVYRHTDQGLHQYRIRIVPESTPTLLAQHADWMHQPPQIFDWTRGM